LDHPVYFYDRKLLLFRCAAESTNYAKLICIITGKGDLKEFYLNKIKEMDFKHVEFITPWLTGRKF
jgi:hypothetical protein